MSPPHQPPGPASPDQGGSFSPRIDRPRPARIICAEDDPDIAAVLCMALEIEEYAVEVVTNGHEARARIAANPHGYDVLITDHDMPMMDGLTLVRQLRSLPFSGGIIVHSASLEPKEAQEYRDLAVAAVLSKPCEFGLLMNAVHHAVELGRASVPPVG